MTIRTPLLPLLASLVAVQLPVPPASGQRRVIGAPPTKAPEEKRDEAKPPDKKDEDKEAKGDPPKAKPGTDPDKADKPADASKGPAKPAGPAVPKDERPGSAKKEDKLVLVPVEPVEVVYRKKVDKMIVTLRVRPAKPMPGQLTTLLFELVRTLDVPDPAVGDRMPEENATLVVTVTPQGKGALPSRVRLHALKDAGVYGMHLTASDAGTYRLELAQRAAVKEIGESPLAAEFTVGIGVATAMPVAEDEESAQKGKRGRSALKVVGKQKDTAAVPATEGPNDVMRELGRNWLKLQLAAEDPKAAAVDLLGVAKAITETVPKADGRVPVSQAIHGKEFDLFVGQLADAVNKDLPGLSTDKQKTKTLARIESDHCLRCHAKFRYRLTDDVSHWPAFEIKEPPESKGKRR